MTKTLKGFLDEASGILKVKNPDEQKFIDKHQVQRTNDRNGNDDDVFGGAKQKKVKAIDRRKERHGYNSGEDASVYEELKGNQHKIDANKNGKVDAQDFKLLRKKKKVAEEAEQIDENWIGSIAKWKKAVNSTHGDVTYHKNRPTGGSMRSDTIAKNSSGNIVGVYQHHNNMGRVFSKTNEEVEQIDEVGDTARGRKALASYTKKAAPQILGYAHSGGSASSKGKEEGPRLTNKAARRMMGVIGAAKRLAKEEIEQVDEVLTAKTPMGTWIKDFQTSRNPKFKGKSQTKRREMAIAAKLSAERGGKKLGEDTDQIDEADYSAKAARAGKNIGKPGKQFSKIAAKAAAKYGSAERGRKVAGAVLAKLRKEDRLVELLSNLPESTRDIMLETFAKLNEDNQYKFIAACETEEGIDQMLNFSIMNRGK